MCRKKKKQSSVKQPAIQRFEKSRSRRIYPAFQNTTFVFCGDWGGASTSMKLSVSARAEIGSFRKVGTALHCLPLSCPSFCTSPQPLVTQRKIEVASHIRKATSIRPV